MFLFLSPVAASAVWSHTLQLVSGGFLANGAEVASTGREACLGLQDPPVQRRQPHQSGWRLSRRRVFVVFGFDEVMISVHQGVVVEIEIVVEQLDEVRRGQAVRCAHGFGFHRWNRSSKFHSRNSSLLTWCRSYDGVRWVGFRGARRPATEDWQIAFCLAFLTPLDKVPLNKVLVAFGGGLDGKVAMGAAAVLIMIMKCFASILPNSSSWNECNLD